MFSPVLLHQYLTRAAERVPAKTALIAGEERWTYGDLNRAASALAGALSRLGVGRQDRVAIYLDNCPEAVISLFGALFTGAVFIILDGGMRAGRLRYILNDSGARVLVTHANKQDVVREALREMSAPCRIIQVGRHTDDTKDPGHSIVAWDDVLDGMLNDERSRDAGAAQACIDQDIAAIIYTSGSSGEPKGVMCSHYNMISVSRSIIAYLENTQDDVLLNVLPLAFGYGLYQVVTAVMVSGTVVLERSIAYPVKALELVQREHVTGFAMVPTIVALLLRFKHLESYGLASLRYITNAAAALPVEHIRRLQAILPRVRIYSMYGLTECARATYLPPGELDSRPHSVGKAIPNTEAFVLNEDGTETAPGEVGELVIRGAHVMRGYWNAPELTARTFRPGNLPGETLLYSGDLFKRDAEGFLYYVGRKDDMIKSKGERIGPREIENVLCALGGIAEAAVIGVPDEILGQAVKAFVVRAHGKMLSDREIMKYCSENLEPFMIPKYVEFIESLPKLPNGKVDKQRLRTELVPFPTRR